MLTTVWKLEDQRRLERFEYSLPDKHCKGTFPAASQQETAGANGATREAAYMRLRHKSEPKDMSGY